MGAAVPLPGDGLGPACCETTGEQLLPVDVALAKGLALARPPVATESVALMAARGRVLAEPAVAPLPMPAFDNAAMDGYAVRCRELAGPPPHEFVLAGRVAAGDDGAAGAGAPEGAALRILTGAPMPEGFDAVVMQERTRVEGGRVVLLDRVTPGQNIRRAGGDAEAGAVLVPAGAAIGARQLGVLAAAGIAEVPVRPRLRVAMFSTGSELRQPGEALAPGQIYNSNRYTLAGMLDRPWIELIDLGAVRDDPRALSATLEEAAARADVVVTTGGVSVGDEDHMLPLVRALGGDIHAMKIAIKPGKPLAIGRLGEALYLGLPGNPVAVFVTMAVVGAPILCRAAGYESPLIAPTPACADFSLTRRPGRREYLPARLVGTTPAGLPLVRTLGPTNSGKVAQLVSADGFAVVEPGLREIAPGTELAWLPMEALPLH